MAQFPNATPLSDPYRPYQLSSQQNNQASTASVHHQDIQTLTQQLDAANKKIDHYAQLIASLSSELTQYREIICVSCKQKVLLAASQTATSITQSDVTPTVPTLKNVSGPIGITAASPGSQSPVPTLIVETGSESSPPDRGSANSSIEDTETQSDDSFTTASQSISDPSNEVSPVVGIDYNSETKQALVLSMVDIFTFTASVHCAKFSRDGNYFAVGLSNGETHIYDVNTKSQSILVENAVSVFYSEAAAASKEQLGIWAVQFNPNNKYIATGREGGQIKIWEVKRKRVRANLNGHTSLTKCIDFSPDGRLLASASYDNTVRVWCTRDGSSKHLFFNNSDFNSVAFSPDGQCVAAGADDMTLRIWDSRTGQLLKQWKIHTYRVWSVAFQPDGKGMASAGTDGTWKSWDLSTFRGRQLLRSPGHTLVDEEEKEDFTCEGQTDTINCVSFSPDGRWVVTSSDDGASRIWDAATGLWVCTLKGHTDSIVWAADFSPTGDYLVTGSTDGRVLLWKYCGVEE